MCSLMSRVINCDETGVLQKYRGQLWEREKRDRERGRQRKIDREKEIERQKERQRERERE